MMTIKVTILTIHLQRGVRASLFVREPNKSPRSKKRPREKAKDKGALGGNNVISRGCFRGAQLVKFY